MPGMRFRLFYVGRGPRLPRGVSDILESAGYSFSALKRTRTKERDGDPIGTWIDARITPAELRQILALRNASGRAGARLFTVELTPISRHRGRSRARRGIVTPAAMSLQA